MWILMLMMELIPTLMIANKQMKNETLLWSLVFYIKNIKLLAQLNELPSPSSVQIFEWKLSYAFWKVAY